MNRFQVVMIGAVLAGAALIATVLSLPGPTALTILRAVGLFLTATVVVGYAPLLNPIPYLRGTAESKHLIGAGVVFFALAIFISLARTTFFDLECSNRTPCYNLVLAGQVFLYVLALLMLIAGPLAYDGLRGVERLRFRAALIVGAVVGIAGLVSGVT